MKLDSTVLASERNPIAAPVTALLVIRVTLDIRAKKDAA